MDTQLNLLIQLQEIDKVVRTLTEKKQQLPIQLKALEERHGQQQLALGQVKEALQTAQKNKRDRDQSLEVGMQKVEKLKARAAEIKTNKEYQAQLKEIATVEQDNKAIEDELLGLMEKIDAASAAIVQAEKQYEVGVRELEAEQRERKADAAKIDDELANVLRERAAVAKNVRPDIFEQYESLVASKNGMALAEARGESCSGCFMSIPPRIFVNVKKRDAIIQCPECNRILYHKQVVTQPNM